MIYAVYETAVANVTRTALRLLPLN